MKSSGKRWVWSQVLSLGLLPVVGGCLEANSSQSAGLAAPATTAAVLPSTEVGEADDAALENAPTQPVPGDPPLPAGLKPSVSTLGLIRLARAGVDEGMMLAYVTNSARPFTLSADEIIYLNDLGVPGVVVTAMIQRDQSLSAPPVATSSPPAPVPATPGDQPIVVGEEPVPPPPEEVPPDFYGPLAPYGTWISVGGYGYCWRPTVGVQAGWSPYFNGGRWVYTDCGWYWLSDYSWGWAPFHYGRWFRHQHLGWCWVPDRVWGPSWVSFRYTDDHCAWAPLPPAAHFNHGLEDLHGHALSASSSLGLTATYFPFVPMRQMGDRQVWRHAVSPEQSAALFRRSTVVTRIDGSGDRVFNHGIPMGRVTATDSPVARVRLLERTGARREPGRREMLDPNGRTLTVYHPPVPAPSTTVAGDHHHAIAPDAPVHAVPVNRAASLQKSGAAPAPPAQNPSAVLTPVPPLILHGPQSDASRGWNHRDRPANDPPVAMRPNSGQPWSGSHPELPGHPVPPGVPGHPAAFGLQAPNAVPNNALAPRSTMPAGSSVPIQSRAPESSRPSWPRSGADAGSGYQHRQFTDHPGLQPPSHPEPRSGYSPTTALPRPSPVSSGFSPAHVQAPVVPQASSPRAYTPPPPAAPSRPAPTVPHLPPAGQSAPAGRVPNPADRASH